MLATVIHHQLSLIATTVVVVNLPIHRLVLLRRVLPKGARNSINCTVMVWMAKVGNGVSRRMHLCCSRWLYDTMYGAFNGIVGPSSQQVTCVDHDCTFDGRGIDEGSIGGTNLQATGHVLWQSVLVEISLGMLDLLGTTELCCRSQYGLQL